MVFTVCFRYSGLDISANVGITVAFFPPFSTDSRSLDIIAHCPIHNIEHNQRLYLREVIYTRRHVLFHQPQKSVIRASIGSYQPLFTCWDVGRKDRSGRKKRKSACVISTQPSCQNLLSHSHFEGFPDLVSVDFPHKLRY